MRESILGGYASEHSRNMAMTVIATAPSQTFAANTTTNRQPAIRIPNNNASVSLKDPKETPPAKVEKRSVEFLLKSGLAGGLAGCAVRTPKPPVTAILT